MSEPTAVLEAPPSDTQTATTTPAPATEAPKEIPSPFNDAFSDLESMFAPEQKPKVEAPKPKAEKPAAKVTEKKPEGKTDKATEAKAPETKPESVAGPKQLREAYESLKSKHSALEKEYGEFKTKASQPKEDTEKKQLSERFEANAKRLKELEDEMRFVAFERSGEYKERYEAPFINAYNAGRNKASAIKVTDGEGASRKGTADDFDAYMRITDEDAAAEYAERVFGHAAKAMTYHRERVQELNQARLGAIDDYRKQGGEREKTRTEAMAKEQKELTELFQSVNKAAIEKYPDLFTAKEDDAKGAELLAKGFALMDRAFSDGSPLQQGDKPLSRQEMVRLQSAMRNKAAAFDYQVHLRRTAEARIKELEEQLSAFEQSQPADGDGKGPKAQRELSPEEQLDQLAVPG